MAPPNKNAKRSNNLTTQTLLDFDLGESSSDSDFRIEDHDDDSDDYSVNSKDDNPDADGDNDDDDEESLLSDESESSDSEKNKTNISTTKLIENVNANSKVNIKLLSTPICCACLGERSDDTNEIVECDGCGVTVHEGCYGVSDSGSVSSTVSSCSTEPWFCEVCKAGVKDPVCELCPNKGGIFKETDVGKWVHLVCALYIPGVAFGEVDQLSSVTLFEMQYSKWGSKTCSLCEDSTFARTGVCIGCDAGMCKNYFHVTCAQSNGLLSEAHSEEADHADPFYAHCKLHSDKFLIKKRKRNYNALKLKMEQRLIDIENRKNEKPSPEQLRIERKLKKHKIKYLTNKGVKTDPWVPTQKMPRLLTTSASAKRRLMYKAQLMGIDTSALELQETQIASLMDVRKKWHIPPAFSIEFIAYYLDRIVRLTDIKSSLNYQMDANKKLLDEQQCLRDRYDQKITLKQEYLKTNSNLKSQINKFHLNIQALCSNKLLPSVDLIGRAPAANIKPPVVPANKPMTVPTAAALKMGVGFPLNNLPGPGGNVGRVLSTQRQGNDALLHDCGICKKFTDQHLLAKCDTCHFYYHLGCLNPPLTRHPKKSKLYGWQCSECDKSDDSEPDISLTKTQRRGRVRYSKDGSITREIDIDSIKDEPGKHNSRIPSVTDTSITDGSFTSTDESIKNSEQNNEMKNNRKRFKKCKTTPSKKVILDESFNSDNGIQSQEIPEQDPLSLTNDDVKSVKEEQNEDITTNKEDNKTLMNEEKNNKKEKKIKKIKKLNTKNDGEEEGIEDNAFENNSFLTQFTSEIITDNTTTEDNANGLNHHKANRKRKKDKHKKYSSDSEKVSNKEHKRKHKRKDIEYTQVSEEGPHPRIKIKFKAIHLPKGESNSTPKLIYVPSVSENSPPIETQPSTQPTTSTPKKESTSDVIKEEKPIHSAKPITQSTPLTSPKRSVASKKSSVGNPNICDVCHQPGTPQNLVNCDECKKNYHFSCLDPPVKKSPKRRGYSWHCADCDPTETESNA